MKQESIIQPIITQRLYRTWWLGQQIRQFMLDYLDKAARQPPYKEGEADEPIVVIAPGRPA